MKKVSIVTPCFNCQDFLEETYKTVLEQTYPHWEWLLVDDCSTDGTYALLQDFAKRDERIKCFKNAQNAGAAVTRNVGLENASGDYIAFLDSDDIWRANKLEKQITHAQQADADFSYHNYETVDASGVKLKELNLASSYTAPDLLKFNPFATSSILVKREVVERNGIRFKEHLRRRQDYFFWYDSIAASKVVAGLDENLSGYRLGNSGSLSSNKLKMAKIQWGLYREEFGLGFLESLYYTVHYALHGLKKYL